MSFRFLSVEEYIASCDKKNIMDNLSFFSYELINVALEEIYNNVILSVSVKEEIIRQTSLVIRKTFESFQLESDVNFYQPEEYNILDDFGISANLLHTNIRRKSLINYIYLCIIADLCEVVEEILISHNYETADITTNIYVSLINFIGNNCSGCCNNNCIINSSDCAYCEFCTDSDVRLKCPLIGETTYSEIHANQSDFPSACTLLK